MTYLYLDTITAVLQSIELFATVIYTYNRLQSGSCWRSNSNSRDLSIDEGGLVEVSESIVT